jgi:hypothetical protein
MNGDRLDQYRIPAWRACVCVFVCVNDYTARPVVADRPAASLRSANDIHTPGTSQPLSNRNSTRVSILPEVRWT